AELDTLLRERNCLVEHRLSSAEAVGCEHHTSSVEHTRACGDWVVGGGKQGGECVGERDIEEWTGMIKARNQIGYSARPIGGDQGRPAVGEIDQHMRGGPTVQHGLDP